MEQPLILDRYRPLADLGEGGHGAVTLAYDTRMARRVAIKRLPLPLDERGRPMRNVGLSEARTSAMLNHPNIVTVHEWDTDEDEAFLVMEYVEGASLADVLDECDGVLESDELAAVVSAVASALSHAHANGVLHLDVKPENVLLARDGSIKVADFGVAALTGIGGRARGSAGTPGYMSPEQLSGAALDERADQWAFAALVYEAAAGANPFAARTVEGALFKSRVGDVPPPSQFRDDIPAELDESLMVALSPDPRDRFENVDVLADELLAVLGEPVSGTRSLAAIVREILGEADDEEVDGLGVWDRLAYGGWGRRVTAALVCGWAAWAALEPLVPQDAPRAGGAALVGLAAALAPALGVALASIALVAGVSRTSGVTAAAIGVVAAAHWGVVARRNGTDGLAALAAPLLALARAAFAVPLLLGFAFTPVRAALAAAFASLAVSTASAASGGGAPLLEIAPRFLVSPVSAAVPGWWRALLDPGVALAAGAWALAAAACSWASGGATRVSAAIGGAVGLGVMAVAYAGWVAWHGLPSPDLGVLQQVAGSLILFGIVVAAGPPLRGEDG